MLTQILGERERPVPPELYVEPRWYACYTYGRHEKRVAAQLQERGIESYLPVVSHRRRYKDRTATVTLPVFPSYVFARFALRDLRQVLTTVGVATVVKVRGYPTPLPDAEIEQVRRMIERAETLGVEPQLEEIAEGEPVLVVGGPFEGVEGVVVQRRGTRRVLVGLHAIGQGLSVEVELHHLQSRKPGADRPHAR
jgi:transcription antitermination factor NusG